MYVKTTDQSSTVTIAQLQTPVSIVFSVCHLLSIDTLREAWRLSLLPKQGQNPRFMVWGCLIVYNHQLMETEEFSASNYI